MLWTSDQAETRQGMSRDTNERAIIYIYVCEVRECVGGVLEK